MMEIYFLGHSSFRIKGKNAAVVTDPFADPQLGFKFPKVEADIVTVSHQHKDHNASYLVGGNPFVISGPGEYEIKGVSIFGYPSFHDSSGGSQRGENTIFLMGIDGLRICHLGDLGESLAEKKLEELGGVDILMIPVGGVYTLGPKEAVDLIAKIRPLIIVPMHFKIPKMGPDFAKLSLVEEFLKEMKLEEITPLPKLVISKDKLPEESQIVLLEAKK